MRSPRLTLPNFPQFSRSRLVKDYVRIITASLHNFLPHRQELLLKGATISRPKNISPNWSFSYDLADSQCCHHCPR